MYISEWTRQKSYLNFSVVHSSRWDSLSISCTLCGGMAQESNKATKYQQDPFVLHLLQNICLCAVRIEFSFGISWF